jgi:hypothetical protein
MEKRGSPARIQAGDPRAGCSPKRFAQLSPIKLDDPGGRSYAEAIAGNLISIACSQDHSAVTAAAEIANRLEGRSMQRLEVNDITADLANRSADELRFHLLHDHWPEDAEATQEPVGLSIEIEKE